MVPESVISQIKERLSIVDVIGDYVDLQQNGRSHRGLCPFHSEKTPSFTVAEEKGVYHCFGCGAGGNAFKFLMELEGYTFEEAAVKLGEKFGIEVPVQAEPFGNLVDANKLAAHYYQMKLFNGVGGDAIKYFKDRGLGSEIIQKFNLGYAPNGWNNLLDQIEPDQIPSFEAVGLIRRGDNGLYDFFRDRLMFPIMDRRSRIIGAGARRLTEDKAVPKYLNSPESPIYSKQKALYGIHAAEKTIRKNNAVLFVEGYMDVLQLMQSGIFNVVATCGTALSDSHAKIVRGLTSRGYLCFDGDAAGAKALVSGGEALIRNGFDVRVVEMPSGEDPDTYVKRFGADGFRSLLRTSTGFLEFYVDVLSRQHDLNSASGLSSAVDEVSCLLSSVPDPVMQAFYWRKSSDLLGVDVSLFDVQRSRKKQKPVGSGVAYSGAWGAERDLVVVSILYPDVAISIDPDKFANKSFADMFVEVRATDDPKRLIEESDAAVAPVIRERMQANLSAPESVVGDCVKKILLNYYQDRVKELSRAMRLKPDESEKYLIEVNTCLMQAKELQK